MQQMRFSWHWYPTRVQTRPRLEVGCNQLALTHQLMQARPYGLQRTKTCANSSTPFLRTYPAWCVRLSPPTPLPWAQELLAFEARATSQLRARLSDADMAMAQLWVYTQFGPAAAPTYPPLPAPSPLAAADAQPAHTTYTARAAESGVCAATTLTSSDSGVCTASPSHGGSGGGAGAGADSSATAAGGCVSAGQRGGCAAAHQMLERRLRCQYEELVRRQQMIAGGWGVAEGRRRRVFGGRQQLGALCASRQPAAGSWRWAGTPVFSNTCFCTRACVCPYV